MRFRVTPTTSNCRAQPPLAVYSPRRLATFLYLPSLVRGAVRRTCGQSTKSDLFRTWRSFGLSSCVSSYFTAAPVTDNVAGERPRLHESHGSCRISNAME